MVGNGQSSASSGIMENQIDWIDDCEEQAKEEEQQKYRQVELEEKKRERNQGKWTSPR